MWNSLLVQVPDGNVPQITAYSCNHWPWSYLSFQRPCNRLQQLWCAKGSEVKLKLSLGKTKGHSLSKIGLGQEFTYLRIVTHDIVQPGQKTCTGRYLWVHGTIDIVQKVESFTDQFVPITEVALLNFVLAAGEHMVRIWCLFIYSKNARFKKYHNISNLGCTFLFLFHFKIAANHLRSVPPSFLITERATHEFLSPQVWWGRRNNKSQIRRKTVATWQNSFYMFHLCWRGRVWQSSGISWEGRMVFLKMLSWGPKGNQIPDAKKTHLLQYHFHKTVPVSSYLRMDVFD